MRIRSVNVNIRYKQRYVLYLYSRVEWFSNFSRFLKTGTMLPISYIFMSPNLKNQWIWQHMRQSFCFPKIAGTLKWIVFSENLHMSSFYFKEQSPKRKFRIYVFFKIFLLSPQIGQNLCLPMVKAKTIYIVVSL